MATDFLSKYRETKMLMEAPSGDSLVVGKHPFNVKGFKVGGTFWSADRRTALTKLVYKNSVEFVRDSAGVRHCRLLLTEKTFLP